jgi:thiamine biosynthesis lipoprotein
VTAQQLRRCRPQLGTYVEIALRGECGEDELLRIGTAAFAEVERVERLLSFHDPDSELSHLNRFASSRVCPVSPELREVLVHASTLSRRSGGAFDVTVGGALVSSGLLPHPGIVVDESANWSDIEITADGVRYARPLLVDLGGIAKGYAVDRALAAIDTTVEAVVNAGGDLRMNRWRGETVAVRHPRPDTPDLVLLPMQAAAVATTAPGFRPDAIVDPGTRSAVPLAGSISVFAPNCMLADALTKIVALVPVCGDLLAEFAASAVLIADDGSVRTL